MTEPNDFAPLSPEQAAYFEKLLDPTSDLPMTLLRRIMDLEACLVYVKNFLPPALKAHCEAVLFHQKPVRANVSQEAG